MPTLDGNRSGIIDTERKFYL